MTEPLYPRHASGPVVIDGWFFARGAIRLGWVAAWRLRQRTAGFVVHSVRWWSSHD